MSNSISQSGTVPPGRRTRARLRTRLLLSVFGAVTLLPLARADGPLDPNDVPLVVPAPGQMVFWTSDVEATIDSSETYIRDAQTGAILYTGTLVETSEGPEVVAFCFEHLVIDEPLRITGSRPVALLSRDFLGVRAVIDASADVATPGPGGGAGGFGGISAFPIPVPGTYGSGVGGGRPGLLTDPGDIDTPVVPASGGGFGGTGGWSIGLSGEGQLGGPAYGNLAVRLEGGSGGGGGAATWSSDGGRGSGGGGALQVGAAGPLEIDAGGWIRADGAASGGSQYGGGAGSGGGLIIMGHPVTVELTTYPRIVADGGNALFSFGQAGGGGRILVTGSYPVTGAIYSGLYSATRGDDELDSAGNGSRRWAPSHTTIPSGTTWTVETVAAPSGAPEWVLLETIVNQGHIEVHSDPTWPKLSRITNDGVLEVFGVGAWTLDADIEGSGSLVLTDDRLVELSGNNSFSGATQIDAGELVLLGGDNLSDASRLTLAPGTSIDLQYESETIGSLAGDGQIINLTGTLEVGGNGDSTTFTGIIGGEGTFQKSGAGTFTCDPDSILTTGDIVVADGGLAFTGATSLAQSLRLGPGSTVSASGPLTLLDQVTGSGEISTPTLGSGVLVAPGSGTSGAGTGSLHFGSDFEVEGLVELEIAGPGAFDSIFVDGGWTVVAGSTLRIRFVDGYVPDVGQFFILGNFGQLIGSFTHVEVLGLDPSRDVRVVETTNAIHVFVTQPDDLREPNDTCDDAAPLAETMHTNLIANPDDPDWYAVWAPGGADLTIQVNASGALAPMALFASCGDPVPVATFPPGSITSLTYTTGFPGSSYYFRVLSSTAVLDYSITVAIDPTDSDDAYEDNDTCQAATILAAGTSSSPAIVTDLVVVSGDPDYYKVWVPDQRRLSVTLTNESGVDEIEFDLHRGTSASCPGPSAGAGLVDVTTSRTLTYDNYAGDHYAYVRVRSVPALLYSLVLTLQPLDDVFEQNDSCADAADFSGAYGDLHVSGPDPDWYRVSVSAGATFFGSLVEIDPDGTPTTVVVQPSCSGTPITIDALADGFSWEIVNDGPARDYVIGVTTAQEQTYDLAVETIASNDDCTGAIELQAGDVATGNLHRATNDGPPACGVSGKPDLWYRFVAPSAGTIVASTCGSHDGPGVDAGVDTVLALQSDCSSVVTCNDDTSGCAGLDAGNARDSRVTYAMQAGEEVLLRVTHFGSVISDGDFVLRVDFEPGEDCNGNGQLDTVDVASGVSPDCNGNGRPDECDVADDFVEVRGDGEVFLNPTPLQAVVAIDQWVPGTTTGVGPISGSTLTLDVGGTEVSIENLAGSALAYDESITFATSDLVLAPGEVVTFTFSTPIYGFYAPLRTDGSTSLHAFSGGVEVGAVSLPSPTPGTHATGIGFTTSLPVDRLDWVSTADSVLGAGAAGFVSGETTLGFVDLPGYSGPTGAAVLADFGLLLAPVGADCNANAIPDECEPGLDGDADGIPDVCQIVPPENDACAAAELVSAGDTIVGDLTGASASSVPCGVSTNPSLWYVFVASTDGTLTVSTCGTHDAGGVDTGTDTIVALYDDCPDMGGIDIACNDDATECGDLDLSVRRDSWVQIPVLEGEIVHIQVSHWGSQSGPFELHVDFEGTPEGPFVRGDCNADGSVNLADAIRLLLHVFPEGLPPAMTCGDACDANDDGALQISDAVMVLGFLFDPSVTALPAPWPNCGADASGDAIDCTRPTCQP